MGFDFGIGYTNEKFMHDTVDNDQHSRRCLLFERNICFK